MCHDTIFCIVIGAWTGRWVVVSRYSICIVTSGPLAEACHDTINCIVTRGQRRYGRWLCCDTTQPGLRYDKRQACDTRRGTRHRATIRPATGCDTAGARPRHGLVCGVRVQPEHTARNLGAPCAQPGSIRCASAHPTQFWT